MKFKAYLNDICNKINDLEEDTFIVRKTKKGKHIDQAFNNKKDADKFADYINGKVFKIKGNSITQATIGLK